MSVVEIGMQSIKARLLLARNIHAILTARGESQTDLAKWCHKKSSWINKILAAKRPLHIDDFDRVADFLGITVYQMFVPGVSALTERRRLSERRRPKDRRVGHVTRMIEIRRPAATGERHDPPASAPSAPIFTEETRAFLADTAQKLTTLLRAAESGGQTPPPRPRLAKSRPRRRAARRPDAPSS